jgi:hypothetical protein
LAVAGRTGRGAELAQQQPAVAVASADRTAELRAGQPAPGRLNFCDELQGAFRVAESAATAAALADASPLGSG